MARSDGNASRSRRSARHALRLAVRLLQSALALGAGAAIATGLRRSAHALWLAPLGVVIIRLVLDPLAFGWYFLEAEALVLVGAGLMLAELPTRFPAARLHGLRPGPLHEP